MEKIRLSSFHSESNPLGLHRVLEPQGVFPQAAQRLDPTLPLYQDEILIEVDLLNLDSVSFRQLSQETKQDPQKIAQRILQITRERGKMQNPVTGSGGMLVGTVIQKGEKSPHSFQVGDRIATLVSLTLTPLRLEKVSSVDLKRGQAGVQGHGILFASGVAALLPSDMEESTALAILDVCGAPAWVKKLVGPQDKVLVVGLGKGGVLSALAASEVLSRDSLWVSDIRGEGLELALKMGLKARGVLADAKDPLGFQEKLRKSKAPLFDLVIDTCNVAETEMASLLAVRPGGRILFFNMATQFSRAVLSAEGMGLEVEMIMGDGYAPGHWQLAFELIRRHPKFREWFESVEE